MNPNPKLKESKQASQKKNTRNWPKSMWERTTATSSEPGKRSRPKNNNCDVLTLNRECFVCLHDFVHVYGRENKFQIQTRSGT